MFINESVFWFCSLIGTGMLVIQLLIGLIGGEAHDVHETDHAGSSIEDGKFKWMSRQTVSGFVMVFGWTGLTCHGQFHLSGPAAAMISAAAGAVAAFITALIFHAAKKAHSSGTIFKIEDAIGKEAIVYQRILPKGTGKVSASVHDFTHEIDAISPYEEEIPSFTSVQIIKKADNKTVVVVPLK
jgi:hypothetical protein